MLALRFVEVKTAHQVLSLGGNIVLQNLQRKGKDRAKGGTKKKGFPFPP